MKDQVVTKKGIRSSAEQSAQSAFGKLRANSVGAIHRVCQGSSLSAPCRQESSKLNELFLETFLNNGLGKSDDNDIPLQRWVTSTVAYRMLDKE